MKAIIFVVLLYSSFCFGQNGYKYLYIEQTNNEIQIKDDIKVFCCVKGKKYKMEEIEPNLFKIDCEIIEIEIFNKSFLIDLNKYGSRDRFINMSIYLEPETSTEDRMYPPH